MFFEKLETRQMFSTGSLSQSITPTPTITISQPTLPAITRPNLVAPPAAAAKPEFYGKGVMRFLVKNGYLTQQEADKTRGRRVIVDNLVQLKTDAQLLGASKAAIERAMALVLKGKNTEAQRTIIADGLNLPAGR